MSEITKCPKCGGEYVYFDGSLYVCPDCTYEVKGSSMVIKRGTKVKSIRLTDNPEEVDCKIDGSSIVLKTCFLKK